MKFDAESTFWIYSFSEIEEEKVVVVMRLQGQLKIFVDL